MNFRVIGAAAVLMAAMPVAAQQPAERNITSQPVMLFSTAPVVAACPDADVLHAARINVEKGDFEQFAFWMGVGECVLLGPGSFGISDRMHANRMMAVHFIEAVEVDIVTEETIKHEQYGPLWVYLGNLAPLDEARPRDMLDAIWAEAFGE